MKQLVFLMILSFGITYASAQNEDCKVLMDSLKGTYTGDCKSGKANGNGNAKGIHTYEGEFKNGLPEGKGKYTWSDGSYYFGNWKKGKKDGKGELHHYENGIEQRINGYWKNNIYKGENESPYVITNVTSEIGRVQVTKMNDKDATVTITVESLSSSNTSFMSNSLQTSTVMTDHQVTRGSYVSIATTSLTNKQTTIFGGVIFPFRCRYNFGNSMIEIEIYDAGSWDIVVPISK